MKVARIVVPYVLLVALGLPSTSEAAELPEANELQVEPSPEQRAEVYPSDHGRGMLIGGSVLVGVGGAVLLTGLGVIIYTAIDINRNPGCEGDTTGDCGDNRPLGYVLGAILAIPGAVIAAGGVPLLVFGQRRKELRGQPMASQAAELSVFPVARERGVGIGAQIRF